MGLDYRDARIISLLSKDPEATQEAIAEAIGISQPAVAMRLKKLKRKGLLKPSYNANAEALGFTMVKVDITTNDVRKVLKTFERCPAFVDGLLTTGKSNLCLFFARESVKALQCMIERHIKGHPAVQEYSDAIITASAKGLAFPLCLTYEVEDRAPCGALCPSCPFYLNGECPGCPATRFYKGDRWYPLKEDGSESSG